MRWLPAYISCVLMIVAATAQGEETANSQGNFNVGTAEWVDPAFRPYLDHEMLLEAINTLSPGLLTDTALQCAVGEDVLLRSHRAITSQKLFSLAARAALEKQDQKALARLTDVAKVMGNRELLKMIRSGKQLLGPSRSATEKELTANPEDKPENYVAGMKDLLEKIDQAQLLNDHVELESLNKQIRKIEVISDVDRPKLLKYVENAKSSLPKPDEQSKMFSKLTAASREWGWRSYDDDDDDDYRRRYDPPRRGINPALIGSWKAYDRALVITNTGRFRVYWKNNGVFQIDEGRFTFNNNTFAFHTNFGQTWYWSIVNLANNRLVLNHRQVGNRTFYRATASGNSDLYGSWAVSYHNSRGADGRATLRLGSDGFYVINEYAPNGQLDHSELGVWSSVRQNQTLNLIVYFQGRFQTAFGRYRWTGRHAFDFEFRSLVGVNYLYHCH